MRRETFFALAYRHMARRAFVPPPSLAPDAPARAGPPSSSRSSMVPGLAPAMSPIAALAPSARTSSPPSAPPTSLGDARRSVPPTPLAEGVPVTACVQLLDRLAATDE